MTQWIDYDWSVKCIYSLSSSQRDKSRLHSGCFDGCYCWANSGSALGHCPTSSRGCRRSEKVSQTHFSTTSFDISQLCRGTDSNVQHNLKSSLNKMVSQTRENVGRVMILDHSLQRGIDWMWVTGCPVLVPVNKSLEKRCKREGEVISIKDHEGTLINQ